MHTTTDKFGKICIVTSRACKLGDYGTLCKGFDEVMWSSVTHNSPHTVLNAHDMYYTT